jgi:hypothetical protein
MKKLKSVKIRQILPVFFTVFIFFNAYSQKLPATQQIGLRAPANIKIDGRATEWNNQFQVHNHATDVFYTIANDDDNLYLTVQAKDILIVKKILMGGITFTINKSAKKNDIKPVGITFPLLSETTASVIGTYLDQKTALTRNTPDRTMQNNSLVGLMNTQLANNLKEIGIKGLKPIDDTLISVYNDTGVKAGMLFDDDGALTYELALPLKYLGLSATDHAMFSYNIKLNSIFSRSRIVMLDPNVPPTAVVIVGSSISGKSGSDNQILNSPTDFWGEYTLAKK